MCLPHVSVSVYKFMCGVCLYLILAEHTVVDWNLCYVNYYHICVDLRSTEVFIVQALNKYQNHVVAVSFHRQSL